MKKTRFILVFFAMFLISGAIFGQNQNLTAYVTINIPEKTPDPNDPPVIYEGTVFVIWTYYSFSPLIKVDICEEKIDFSSESPLIELEIPYPCIESVNDLNSYTPNVVSAWVYIWDSFFGSNYGNVGSIIVVP